MARRLLLLLGLLAVPASAHAAIPDVTVPAARDTEPVVLTGEELGGIAATAETTLQLPLMDLLAPDDDPHNDYAEPLLSTQTLFERRGPAVDWLAAYRWDGARFVEIPFQVDERFVRYLDNTASGFAIYSGQEQHLTYAYEREGFRWRADGPADDPCRARPASPVAVDPVQGLDTDDEVAFMARDAGPAAPARVVPPGARDTRKVEIRDPLDGTVRYAYVAHLWPGTPRAAVTPYVRYARDPDADLYAFSESSYRDYGNAPQGLYCDADGNVVRNADDTPRIGRRRPRDGATIRTPRYRFRYDGRWLMTRIQVSPDGGATYGRDLVDRFKARAFAQDPASETPCCGYEEEDNNWGGSSVLLGEKAGPVRAIRETWGADSGTNVVRRETFYRDEVVQRTWLRVHPIPPLDGIYAQWDFNAGAVDRFYNARRPAGVPVDGRNDEVLGNFDDPCNTRWDGSSVSELDQTYRTLYRALELCELPYHQSIDPGDPTFSDLNAALGWSVTTGDHGTIVDRLSLAADAATAGGVAQGLLALPYYRDDACFDDGTGSDPGPKLTPRSGNEPSVFAGLPRRCWTPADGDPAGSARFYQGSIATHGMHLLAIAESDNLRLPVPLTEITADWRLVMLPGRRDARAGEQYGRRFEKPLVVTTTDAAALLSVPPRISLPGLG